MRILVLMRGLPGSGKSTWIRENGLEPYTLSADKLRLMYSAPVLNQCGVLDVCQKKNTLVFKTLMEILSVRMNNGDFTIIDACHISESDFQKYRDLAKKYRYRVIAVDFSDVPLEECKRRNALRDEMNILDDSTIERMNSRMKQTVIPSWIQCFSHNERIVL
jgi:predicted kinase